MWLECDNYMVEPRLYIDHLTHSYRIAFLSGPIFLSQYDDGKFNRQLDIADIPYFCKEIRWSNSSRILVLFLVTSAQQG